MDDPLFKIWEVAGGFGLAVGCLVMGVRWLGKDRDKIVKELHDERVNRIAALEAQSEQCQKDRADLYRQIGELHQEVRTIYRGQIAASQAIAEAAVGDEPEADREEEGQA